MPPESNQDKRFQAEVDKIREEEAHKEMLYDKSIGGPMVPRPSDDFIRQNVGDLKSEDQINQQATDNIDKQDKAEAAQAERQAQFDASVEAHNARLEQNRELSKNSDAQQAKEVEEKIERPPAPPAPPQAETQSDAQSNDRSR